MSKQTARNEPLFQAEDLCQYFQIARGKTLKAVDHVNFTRSEEHTSELQSHLT